MSKFRSSFKLKDKDIEYINKIGIDNIERKLFSLTDLLLERLESIKNVSIYKSGCGIVSFNLGTLPSSLLSDALDKYGVYTRGGLHCAPSVHRKLGTLEQGAVRISLSYLNTKSDIDRFYRVMKRIAL